MDKIVIDHKWLVWTTIKALPSGKYLIYGSDKVLSELKRIVYEYSNMAVSRGNAIINGDRPLKCYTQYVDNIPMPGCLVFESAEHSPVEDFDPKVSFKGLVMVAIDQVFKGLVEEAKIYCEPAKIQQVRTIITMTGHLMTVSATPDGCTIRTRTGIPTLPLAKLVRDEIAALAETGEKRSFKTVMPSQSGYVRVLVSNYAKSMNLDVACSINGAIVELWIKPDPLTEACDVFIEKWTARGRHHAEINMAIGEAVERYKEKVFNLTAISQLPPDEPDEEEENTGGMGLVDAVMRFRQREQGLIAAVAKIQAPEQDEEPLI